MDRVHLMGSLSSFLKLVGRRDDLENFVTLLIIMGEAPPIGSDQSPINQLLSVLLNGYPISNERDV